MSAELLPGARIVLSGRGGVCRVQTCLGQGGQGAVYRISPRRGEDLALKWYHPRAATPSQEEALSLLVEQGPPSAGFLWPLYLATAQGLPGFGYAMPLRPGRYVDLALLLSGGAAATVAILARAGVELADAFLQLHTRGLCYRDISFGNVFLDPKTGEILVCDNDNVGESGSPPDVLGTPAFMAPEIVAGLALPDTNTDLHSLAVLLFYLLARGHPLEGRREAAIHCLDEPARRALYGPDALFVFDPVNLANRPVPGYHDKPLGLWPLYPARLRDTFAAAFGAGLRRPAARPRTSDWRRALARLRDAVGVCPACGGEILYDPDFPPARCPLRGCGAPLPRAPRLLVAGREPVALHPGATLFPHHFLPGPPDLRAPVARVRARPGHPGVFGLGNLGGVPWDLAAADGGRVLVLPDRSAPLVPGTRLAILGADAQVIAP